MSGKKPKPQTFSMSTIPHLHHLLLDLHKFPHPVLPSPPNLKRRASVALIVRIRPHYRHPPSYSLPDGTVPERLDAFFGQEWVKHGDAEILFIKRAANDRDKWTGHIAFPGGRRDPGDADDYAAAVRETMEEVGIDLRADSGVVLPCGNLSQTVITASWGETPLMVFCPYVFLVVDNSRVQVRPQPSEVASTHWVPLRALLDPRFRTYWLQDVSSRTARSDFGMKRAMHRVLTGVMLFAAVRLHPSESVFATEAVEWLDVPPRMEADCNIAVPLVFARARLPKRVDTGEALLLWGLTLSVVGDFVDMLPPFDALRQFVYPTFTALDVRFWVWLLSLRYRTKMAREAKEEAAKLELPDAKSDVVMYSKDGQSEERYYGRLRAELRGRRGKAAFDLLPGYYPIVRKGVVFALMVRVVGFGALLRFLYKRWRG